MALPCFMMPSRACSNSVTMSVWRQEKTRSVSFPLLFLNNGQITDLLFLQLALSTLNVSKSAYVCFTFAANRFFSRFNFEGNAQYRERFACQLYIKSLLTIFRARGGASDASRENASIERCDVAIDDGVGRKSRLVARISFRNGIAASHSLPYEVKAPTHAKFNQQEAENSWAISSKTLRQLMDHFGPGIELLDINTDEENRAVNFTCFTEKVQKRGTANNEGKV